MLTGARVVQPSTIELGLGAAFASYRAAEQREGGTLRLTLDILATSAAAPPTTTTDATAPTTGTQTAPDQAGTPDTPPLLPESTGDRDGPWDVVGALMAAAGLFGVVLAVKRLGGGHPPFDPGTALALLGGGGLLAAFVRRQRRRTHPLVDLRMFARPAFSTSVGCIVLAMLALVGLELIAAQYLQLVLGLSPLETGLRLLANFARLVGTS